MRRIVGSLMALLLVGAASQASARDQDQTGGEPAITPPMPVIVPLHAPTQRDDPRTRAEKVRLLERYFEAIRMERLIEEMVSEMAYRLLDRDRVPTSYRSAAHTALTETFDEMRPLLLADYIDLYADHFTVEEMRALVAFYEGPIGRSLAAKTESLARVGTTVGMRRMDELERVFRGHFRAAVARGQSGSAVDGRVEYPDPPIPAPTPPSSPLSPRRSE